MNSVRIHGISSRSDHVRSTFLFAKSFIHTWPEQLPEQSANHPIWPKPNKKTAKIRLRARPSVNRNGCARSEQQDRAASSFLTVSFELESDGPSGRRSRRLLFLWHFFPVYLMSV
ncbi:hypothetical protein GWI33_004418 [Rhynchophorus ferrugineus]|uniref:Uncharacterized protein n=1 Tax=Rhynchophorus ferrugineus TaxID=354439 RepID=A0A834MFI0_RHYFE|nr:hypothetical protein GWI33_004418 [Rhynchophorus ferrugineus]